MLSTLDRTQNLPPAPDPIQPIVWTAAASRRPRLLVTPEELLELKSRLTGPVESEMLARLNDRLDRALADYQSPDPGDPILDRSISAWQVYPALLFCLTGEQKRLEQAKRLALELARCDRTFQNQKDLPASHALNSLAWAYDLLYEEWTKGERAEILDFVREFGTRYAAVSMIPVNYWSNILLQNHCQVFWTAMGSAGIAFREEIEQAAGWAEWSQRIYRTISWMQPPDGTNVEGPSYGGYGNERRVIYYEAALRNFGENLYQWGERESGRWYLHLSLPGSAPDRNAFPWGDNSARFDVHGPVHTLLAYAKRFRDPLIQGLAMNFWRKKIGANGYLTWMDLLHYDPSVPEQTPQEANEPTSRHFTDQDLICARSAWNDDLGTAVSFICGPYQGHRLMGSQAGDLGGAHCHADTASLQLYGRGEFLLCDPGYEKIKRTDHHNTVLVDGHGQLGAGIKWFDVNRVQHFADSTKIQVRSFKDKDKDQGQAVGWVGDAAEIYRPEAGLKKFLRHVLFIRPDVLIVFDDLEAERDVVFSQLWHAERSFEKVGSAGWGFTQGQAGFSAWPLKLPDHGEQVLEIRRRKQELIDLTQAGAHQFELCVDSPRTRAWRFVTVFAIGKASDGPPLVEARISWPDLEVKIGQTRKVKARFDVENASAPQEV